MVGIFVPFMLMGRSAPTSFDYVVKMVVEDFGAEIKKFLALYHESSLFRYWFSLLQISTIFGPDPSAVSPSAYVTTLLSGFGEGMVVM